MRVKLFVAICLDKVFFSTVTVCLIVTCDDYLLFTPLVNQLSTSLDIRAGVKS